MLTHRSHPSTRLGHLRDTPALRAFVLGPDPDWEALAFGASQPGPQALPDGYVIQRRYGVRGGQFADVKCFRLTHTFEHMPSAAGWLVGEFATEAEAITAAHEDDDEQHREHECDCGATVTGPGMCTDCWERQEYASRDRGDW